MAVKAKYSKQADIPDALKADYKEVDGVWLLDVDGGNTATHVPKSEFDRVKNESETRKTTLAKYKDLDPDKVAADTAELVELRKGAGNQQVAIDAATARLTKEKENLEKKVQETSGQLSTLLLDNRFKDLAAKDGVKPEAIPFFVDAARKNFEVVNGELVPRDSLKGKDGKPLTPDEWTTERKTDSAFLFLGSSGGGAGNQAASKDAAGNSSKLNPYKKESFNLTQQGIIEIGNPTEAAAMRAEAGVK